MSTISDALGLMQDPEASLQPSVPINANADQVAQLLAGAVTRSLTSDANYTLVAADYQTSVLSLTSWVRPPGRDRESRAYCPPMLVLNGTGQTLTLKKSGQTGVTVDDGESIIVYCGASDVLSGGGGGGGAAPTTLELVTEASAFTAVAADHAGTGRLVLAGGDVTFDNAETYAAGQAFNLCATAAIDLVEDGVTLTPPAGGTLALDADMAVTVVMTGATTGRVIGQTVPA